MAICKLITRYEIGNNMDYYLIKIIHIDYEPHVFAILHSYIAKPLNDGLKEMTDYNISLCFNKMNMIIFKLDIISIVIERIIYL